MHHHLVVHLQPRTEVSIMARILRTSRLNKPNPKLVWHKEGVGLLHVLSVVETTLVNVVIARKLASSVSLRVTS